MGQLPRVPMSNGRQIPQNTNVSYKSHKIGPELDSCQGCPKSKKLHKYININTNIKFTSKTHDFQFATCTSIN